MLEGTFSPKSLILATSKSIDGVALTRSSVLGSSSVPQWERHREGKRRAGVRMGRLRPKRGGGVAGEGTGRVGHVLGPPSRLAGKRKKKRERTQGRFSW